MDIFVDDFVTERSDAAVGIRQAVRYALSLPEPSVLMFSAGSYSCVSSLTHPNSSIAHDDGCGKVEEKECHILVSGGNHLTLRGSTNADGTPSTLLVGLNNGEVQTLMPSLIWTEGCSDLTLENLAFTRKPETSFAAEVHAIHGNEIVLDVDGTGQLPSHLPLYCMNVLDPGDRGLKKPSLTVGFGLDLRMVRGKDGFYRFTSQEIANNIVEGELLSWHQAGITDFLLFFGGCKNLVLSNLRIYNSNGSAMLTENCRNIKATGVVIQPSNNKHFAASRDGWKIYRCTGDVILESCHIEGVRMDGQNVHSNYLIVEQRIDDHTLVCKAPYVQLALSDGSQIEFSDGRQVFLTPILSSELYASSWNVPNISTDDSASAVVGKPNRENRYLIHFAEPLPTFIAPSVLARAMCWEVSSYTCRNTIFRNIAGAGNLVRCSNVLLEGNLYENIMNAGILLGSELSTHIECSNVTNVVIRGNIFRNNGFKPRYGKHGKACIAIRSQGFYTACNGNILIENNKFFSSQCAIELHNVQQVTVRGNEYTEIVQKVFVDAFSTNSIEIEENF
ncbi:MAG: right-handed parallel beta-helix repeat-containing protein [Sphaerochaeta sp.]|nr:right-handed parallel beta-helix repeat-containing protein [Sphaerochaeta sp.]